MLENILAQVRQSPRNLTYSIHIDPVNYFVRETNTDLSPYLNNYG